MIPIRPSKSQHQLPVRNINPSAVLEPDLTKRRDMVETKALMKRGAGLIWKRGTADSNVYTTRS